MNDAIKAGLVFNAASIPCEKFMRLCKDYGEFELRDSLLEELGLTGSQKLRVSGILAKDCWAERELECLADIGGRFIAANDVDYPAKLFGLKNPPVGIYVKGKLNLALPSVAIVGTRQASSYGLETAFRLGEAIACNGTIIISGGAKGIDAAGHKGALNKKGLTAAVFGTGLDRIYPVEHRNLFEKISVNGALVSEYPLGTSGEGWRFIARNRIIAALAGKVVVVESPENGGALHTAKYGFELGREVWVVPGRISDAECSGSNRLLGNGARVLADIEEFAGSREQLTLGFESVELNEDEKKVYSLIQRKGGRTLDEIAAVLKMDEVDVSSAVITLEAEGLVECVGGRYSEAGNFAMNASKSIARPEAVDVVRGIKHFDGKAASLNEGEHSNYESLTTQGSSTVDKIATGSNVKISGEASGTDNLSASTGPNAPSLSKIAQSTYEFLRTHSSSTLDQITAGLNLKESDAVSALAELEAENLVLHSGGRYSADHNAPSSSNAVQSTYEFLHTHSSSPLDTIATGPNVKMSGDASGTDNSLSSPDHNAHSLSNAGQSIYDFLSTHSSSTLDQITAGLNLEIGDAVSALAELEAENLVLHSGGRYSTPYADNTPASTPDNINPQSLTDEEQRIYKFLQSHPNSTVDEIISALSLENSNAAISLISLEAQNLILFSGGRYSATA
ncbi:MAG: DNA-processing protein DprA [Synergistaceae bacterium]|nr:DNA-processing protein DprA [Synergistaceae bacterium]